MADAWPVRVCHIKQNGEFLIEIPHCRSVRYEEEPGGHLLIIATFPHYEAIDTTGVYVLDKASGSVTDSIFAVSYDGIVQDGEMIVVMMSYRKHLSWEPFLGMVNMPKAHELRSGNFTEYGAALALAALVLTDEQRRLESLAKSRFGVARELSKPIVSGKNNAPQMVALLNQVAGREDGCIRWSNIDRVRQCFAKRECQSRLRNYPTAQSTICISSNEFAGSSGSRKTDSSKKSSIIGHKPFSLVDGTKTSGKSKRFSRRRAFENRLFDCLGSDVIDCSATMFALQPPRFATQVNESALFTQYRNFDAF